LSPPAINGPSLLTYQKAGKRTPSGFDLRSSYHSDFADQLLRFLEILIYTIFSLLAFNPIAFLDSTNKPFPASFDSVEIVIGQLSPLLLAEASKLFPIACKNLFIHSSVPPVQSLDKSITAPEHSCFRA
jgi:hypothetical protein